jgi:hypothetical protein
MGRNIPLTSKVLITSSRTDNSVKNHYHSKLRKAFRKINKCITDHLRHDFRPFKDNLLSKIIQAAEEYYSQDVGAPSDKAKTALSTLYLT